MIYLLKAVGADPEFFLKNGWGGGVPAIGRIGGTKQKPQFINNDGFSAIQEDNVMVEFNILPAKSARQFADNTIAVIDHLVKKVRDQGLLIAIQPHMEFEPRQLEHPQAKAIGCEGDFNAWTMRPNERLNADKLGCIRTAGAHVHVSYAYNGHRPNDTSNVNLVRMLDIALGLPSVWLDQDNVRRKFYGKAGAFRPKPYGVEYRTLSNFWIKNSILMEWVFNQVRWSIDQLNANTQIDPAEHTRIRKAIDEGDRGLAQELMAMFSIKVPDDKGIVC